MKIFKLFCVLIVLVVFTTVAFFAYTLYYKPHQIARTAATASVTPLPLPDPAKEDFEKALELKNSGKQIESKVLLDAIVEGYSESQFPSIESARQLLGEINVALFFSNAPGPGKDQYVVRSGDSLARVSGATKSSVELIMRANNLSSTMLHPGQTLVIPRTQFSVNIDRARQKLTLLNAGKFFKEYPIKAMHLPVSKRPAVITTKVSGKSSWKNGKPVTAESKDYADSTRWVQLAAGGMVIFSDSTAEGAKDVDRPAIGIEMTKTHMAEIAPLLNRSSIITISK